VVIVENALKRRSQALANFTQVWQYSSACLLYVCETKKRDWQPPVAGDQAVSWAFIPCTFVQISKHSKNYKSTSDYVASISKQEWRAHWHKPLV